MSPSPPRRRPRTERRPSSTEWLELLATDGPFLAAPVVTWQVWLALLPRRHRTAVAALWGRLLGAEASLDLGNMQDARRSTLMRFARPGSNSWARTEKSTVKAPMLKSKRQGTRDGLIAGSPICSS